MPSHEEHCIHSLNRYGIRGDDIHSWIDEPSQILGGAHRSERHDINSLSIAIEIFGKKYGDNKVRQIFLDHLFLDSREDRTRRTEFKEPDYPSVQIQESPNVHRKDVPVGSFGYFMGVLMIAGIIGGCVLGIYAIDVLLDDPIGFWWSNNWLNIVEIILALALGLAVIYALKDRSRIANKLWKWIY